MSRAASQFNAPTLFVLGALGAFACGTSNSSPAPSAGGSAGSADASSDAIEASQDASSEGNTPGDASLDPSLDTLAQDLNQPDQDGSTAQEGGAKDHCGNLSPTGHLLRLSDYPAASAVESFAKAFADAVPGDALFVPKGNYPVDANLKFKSSIAVCGEPTDPPVLEGLGSSVIEIKFENLQDVTVRNVHFTNLALTLAGASSYATVRNITFRDCGFSNGRVTKDWEAFYLGLQYTDDVTVEHCTFLRSSADFGGRGVGLYRSHHTVVRDNFFGTTRALEPAQKNGYFRTAINVYGNSEDGSLRPVENRLQGNVARRAEYTNCPTDAICEDHGLYVRSFDGLDVVDNRVDGWDTSASGGGLKLRNAERARVLNNSFTTSGVLLYSYGDDTNVPFLYLHQVWVHNNAIDLEGAACSTGACGLSYWRNFGQNSDTGPEKQILLTQNRFLEGGTIRIASANLAGFCVEDNSPVPIDTSTSANSLPQQNCAPNASWSNAPAGVFVADFNADGEEDYVYFDSRREGGEQWVGHLSDHLGYRVVLLGSTAGFSDETNRYRGVVGNFEGNAKPALVLRGLCGADSHRCWRLFRFSASKVEALDWGDEAGFSHTNPFGLLTGDFDGDGRTDVAYWGICGADDHACFRVHRSTPAGFVAQDWGDSTYFSAETVPWGIHVGDFDGDGRADLLYRGKCGTDAHLCWRVHRSQGIKFVASDWGDEAYFVGDSHHLGLNLRDINGDNRTDLGYRGACGASVLKWRYHVSTGSGFTIQCSDNPL